MISYPLTRAHRLQLARSFSSVPQVDISIDCVLEDQMGRAFVDSVDNPQLWMIEQDQFFCYYAGDFSSPAGREFLGQTPSGRMLMAGSPGWHDAVQSVFGERLMRLKRWSYESRSLRVEHLQQLAAGNPHTPAIQKVDTALAAVDSPYLSIGGFESPEDFVQRGIGFCLPKDNRIIGGAYASLVCSDAIEVSIVVDENFYRQGIATALACQLLLWCLEHHLAPHWDAANHESCRLAEKLGYTYSSEYTAWYLK